MGLARAPRRRGHGRAQARLAVLAQEADRSLEFIGEPIDLLERRREAEARPR